MSDIKKAYDINPVKARDKYAELFYYFDGLIGTAISQSMHPAGIVASPITLTDNYGTFWKDGQRITQINMEEIHEVGLVKYDILGLKNVGIIKECARLIGEEFPKSHSFDWCDKYVWEDMAKSPVGVFQFESDASFSMLKRMGCMSIEDLARLTALIRPSCASFREDFLNNIPSENPSDLIDELLKDNKGYLLFQEDVISFLQEICGLSGSDADNVRRAIGRKQLDRLQKALPQILEGYCAKSIKDRVEAEEEAMQFLKVIEDASNYMFNKSHAVAYSMITYVLCYYRYHHPLEFITAFLNISETEDDIVAGTELAKFKNIQIYPPKFRYSKGKYHPDKETNSIYKGIGSIKFCNDKIGEEMYALRDKSFTSFVEVLVALGDTSINSRQIEILIKLNFFSEFGGNKKLLEVYKMFTEIYDRKQFKKESLPLDITCEEMKVYAGIETEKLFKNVDVVSLLNDIIEQRLQDMNLSIKETIKAEIEYLGYISYIDNTIKDQVVLVKSLKENRWGAMFVTLYQLSSGKTVTIKVNKKYYLEYPFEEFDIIFMGKPRIKDKVRKVEGKWVKTGETEFILESWGKVE